MGKACENTREIVIMGTNRTEKKAILFNPRCKSWDCEYCAEQNKLYWIEQASRGAIILTSEGQQLQFITLTSRGYTTPTSSVFFFQQNWPRLRKRAANQTNLFTFQTGISWAYFLVPERHKSGVLHAHLIACTHIHGRSWWKNAAYASGFGYQLKIDELIEPAQVASYVAKYLHKDAGGIKWPPGFRRVRHSQNWPVSSDRPLEDWNWLSLRKELVWIEKGAAENLGYHIIDKT